MHMQGSERALRQRLRNDFLFYAKNCLQIRTKTSTIEPLVLNKVQLYVHELLERQLQTTGKVRAIILKGRQQGCSTYIEGRLYWKTTQGKGLRTFILTHEDQATQNLFAMASLYHDSCPIFVRPSTSSNNAKEMFFDKLNSGYRVGTAKNRGTGRSSTINYFHGSEVAFWPFADEHAAGVMQAIPSGEAGCGTEVILESTANGFGNYFQNVWRDAEKGVNGYLPIFIPWFWQDEYREGLPLDFSLDDEEEQYKELYQLTDAQILWRRNKIAEFHGDSSRFDQEYPATAALAFRMSTTDSYIKPIDVMKARKYTLPEYAGGARIGGCDPAGGGLGSDRSTLCMRVSRKVFPLQVYTTAKPMELVYHIIAYIKDNRLDKMFIDMGGLGAGVVDRLNELGHGDKIVPVDFGGEADDKTRYRNKRAEMWSRMKEYIEQTMPVDLPDSDSLHMDICSVRQEFQSDSRVLLESKKSIKSRGLPSPDEGDALALTFASPVGDAMKDKEIQYDDRWLV